MEERKIPGGLTILAWLKSLPLTGKYDDSDGKILMSCIEFPEAYSYEGDIDTARKELVKALREWTRAIMPDASWWVKGREEQLPYLLKILISTDEELLTCLRSVK